MLILKLTYIFKSVCTIYLSITSKQQGWIVFLQCIGNVEGFGHVYTRQGKLPGILPRTHTQNPNVADVTIELFAKSGMQWQTNSRGFHWTQMFHSLLQYTTASNYSTGGLYNKAGLSQWRNEKFAFHLVCFNYISSWFRYKKDQVSLLTVSRLYGMC
jgi:hypothetical protein